MGIRRQDIAVLIFYYAGYSRLRNRLFRSRGKAVVQFVTFHDIPPGMEKPFENHLRFLKRKTNVISLGDFLDGRVSLRQTNIVITFDDGYRSWATVAAPLLKKWGMPATFFVSSGFVGLSKDEESDFLRSRLYCNPDVQRTTGGLSLQDLRRLADLGFSIGGHTLTHCHLERIRDLAGLKYEIEEDKRRLEAATGREIEFFAYPFGECRNPKLDLARALEESGYRAAVTTASGLNGPELNPYFLNRELTGASLTRRAFRARAYGNIDAVLSVKRVLKRLTRRT